MSSWVNAAGLLLDIAGVIGLGVYSEWGAIPLYGRGAPSTRSAVGRSIYRKLGRPDRRLRASVDRSIREVKRRNPRALR